MISVVILIHSEANQLERCLKSVRWCDEVIIISDTNNPHVEKNIRDLIARLEIRKCQFLRRKLDDDYSSQRNFGLQKATFPWVLFIDSDEWLSQELVREIQDVTSDKEGVQNTDGWFIPRRDFFMGRWLTNGETGSLRLLRLAKKTAGVWEGTVHEEWKIKGSVSSLRFSINHFPHPSLGLFVQKINRYSSLVAKERFDKGIRTSVVELIVYPKAKFVSNFYFKKGYRDGVPGFIMAMMMSFHSFLVRAKLWEMYHS